ncbi:protein MKS1 [Lycium barbarum]|uniref:protein MKS1 n=1 Tax=Lycium barbarum TaxID=112863 RepID=UPI00293EF0AC|nr:protein MKS1 [Lycium barbarum]
MDFPPPDFFAGAGDGRPSPTRRELQGPRPTPLKVNKDSYKIKKPPVAPHPHAPPHAPPPATSQNPQTVIIYAVSPKVYHTTVSDFMSVVQRLTGSSPAMETSTSGVGSGSGFGPGSGDGTLSPAARLASMEKASSPCAASSGAAASGVASGVAYESNDMLDIMNNSNVEMSSQIPGILSPAPATLPPASPPGLFSPFTSDPFMMMLSPSPSTLFSAPLISPSPSASDLFHPFFDF